MNVLIKGSKGKNVQMLQHLLNDGLPNGRRLSTDGDFGQQTDALVRAFQATHRLTPDGIVGPKTWALLTGHKQPIQLGLVTQHSQPPQRAQSIAPAPRPDIAPNLPTNASAPWLDIAYLEEGVRAISGVNHNKRIIEYHAATSLRATDDETAWCSSFANWCLKQAGFKGTTSAAAISWLKWPGGVELASPKTGAITVVYDTKHSPQNSGNHVSFFLSKNNDSITLFGGNQHSRVQLSNYPLSRWKILGYRWTN